MKELSDEYLECRAARRHDFSWRRARHERMRDPHTRRDMRRIIHTCPRCGTKRIDLFWESARRQTGGKLVVLKMERIGQSRYEHPDDYLALGLGLAPFDADDILVEMVHRFPGEVVELT